MGYTHYWNVNNKIEPVSWFEMCQKVKAIIAAAEKDGVRLGDGLGENTPEIGEGIICFNGACPEDYETFSLTPTSTGFAFCKTAHRPYDVVVCATLLATKNILGDGFTFESDGALDDPGWVAGYELLARATVL